MKIKFLIPPQMNVQTIVGSLIAIDEWKHEITTHFLGQPLPDITGCDLIIYTGATDGIYSLSIDTIKKLRETCPIIFISCAGGDCNWHPLLISYANENIFDLVINIDGNFDWPKRPIDLDLIGCVDPRPYREKRDKDVLLGYNAASHPARDNFIGLLGKIATAGPRTEQYGDYKSYAEFLMHCKYFLNINWTSSDEIVRHCNMKIIEAGLAGCWVLEKKGSWVGNWFTEGVEYSEYEPTVESIGELLSYKDTFRPAIYGASLRTRILRDYSNVQFWTKVFSRIWPVLYPGEIN